jgi:hypothetical protein
MWTTGVYLLGDDANLPEANLPRLEFLRAMMLQHPEDVSKLAPPYCVLGRLSNTSAPKHHQGANFALYIVWKT